ncbi:MAG: GDP-6-deoxy-D-mannose reductase [Myxococcaceae bacterium]|nr:GDP-6-deoxy-D-mannose reductase [Myxococcaceae bacterium]
MAKILITGFSGFVSRHFVAFLEQNSIQADILGVGRSRPVFPIDGFRHVRCQFRHLDLLDRSGVDDVIYSFRPDYILHLAAYSSVGFSWQKPVESFTNNTNVLLNLLEQVRSLNLRCRILSVGSSEEYGNVDPSSLPLREERELHPVSPYGVARVAQELLSKLYVTGYGLDVVMTRSFNHIGCHQRDVFVVPSFAKQLSAIRYEGAASELVTGDRSIIRDFVDVRDVVRAYYYLLKTGTAGEVYNVCSGLGTSLDDLIQQMQELLGTKATLRTAAHLVRPNDNQSIIGAKDKISAATGWQPEITLRESLTAILDSCSPNRA